MAYPGPYGQHPGGYPAAGPPGYPQPGAPPGGYGPSPGYPGAPPPAAHAGYPGAPAPGGYGGAPPPGGYAGYPGEYPGGIDPQVAQWFQTVDADRSGRITASELQKALVNANWTQFNPEACRLMIGMFDRDMSGTIDINEFQSLWQYILQWRSTFERYDGNRSGSIEAPELIQAYRQMGYNVSQRFADTVIYKFDYYGKRSLTLDNFIQSCVMLKSLSDAFRQRDTTGCGSVQMPYEDFITMAVLYKP